MEVIYLITENSLEEHSDKISDEDKATIETAITELKEALKGTDVEIIKAKTQSLSEASMKLGEAIYKSQQEEATSEESKSEEKKEDIIDAEFEEVDKA